MPETQKNFYAVRRIRIDEDYRGQRIDNYLMGLLKGVPRSFVYRILRRGEVRVNRGRIQASYRLQPGDLVRVPPVQLAPKAAPGRPGERVLRRLDGAILLETPRFLVINKPTGMAVHGGSGLNFGVIEALRILRPEEHHLELVHRLDRETSGCLLISRKRSALRILHELLRTDGVDKRYLALLAGRWDKKTLEVDAPLRKNTLRSGERIVRIDPQGKPARTRFRRLERFDDATLVEAQLLTGRTHQIRVHAAHLGMPILGDPKYGDEQANRGMRERGLKRMFLHARVLRFRWPDEDQAIQVEAPLDAALEGLLSDLKR
jgi:23S rRNA pseudouridine955/2504/2580 synthase